MEAIKLFLEVVQNNQFVEGHEVLEEEWHRLKKMEGYEDEAKILKGLINGSTALALACKGKMDGAQRVWNTYEKYAPLVTLSHSENKVHYKEAQTLLEEKYRFYM